MIGRWVKRLGLWACIAVLALLSPVVYVELACSGGNAQPNVVYTALLPPEHHRAEARTLMTYPEWHIVHAYDDYAKIIETDDPHAFGFLNAIAGFWSATCDLSRAAVASGGVDGTTKQMIYVIGVSFTAELLAKAAYEETLGRLAALLRGSERAPLDNVSAGQARAYASFLQQTPWYLWDFDQDRATLHAATSDAFRDRERRFALGLEYRVKSAYAGLIESAVAATGNDALRLHMVISGVSHADLSALSDVAVVGEVAEGTVIETPRYRQLTEHLALWADQGGQFIEIAGNDDILLTVTGPEDAPVPSDTIASFDRQGYGDKRLLRMVKVTDLAGVLRDLDRDGYDLEHIHDY